MCVVYRKASITVAGKAWVLCWMREPGFAAKTAGTTIEVNGRQNPVDDLLDT